MDLVMGLQDTFVDAAIGVGGNISDTTASTIAVGFYRKLAAGASVQNAYNSVVQKARLMDICEDELPKLILRPGVSDESLSLDVVKDTE